MRLELPLRRVSAKSIDWSCPGDASVQSIDESGRHAWYTSATAAAVVAEQSHRRYHTHADDENANGRTRDACGGADAGGEGYKPMLPLCDRCGSDWDCLPHRFLAVERVVPVRSSY